MKNKSKLIPYHPTEELMDENFIGKVIIECLKNNDPEGVMDIISTYLNTINKMRSSQEISLPRSTLYSSLKTKNPTIKTLAKLVYASTLNSRKK